MTNKKVKEGKHVFLEFVGKLDDGTVFDKVSKENPFKFKIGENKVLKAFQEEIKGMKEGETKEFTIPKEKAYGKRDKKKIFEITKEILGDKNIKEGDIIALNSADSQFPAKVLEINDDKITIDTNPILAGKDLTYKVKIIEIKDKE